MDRVLIIQTAFPGDVILTLPLLQILKANFPESKIDFLCIPATSEILKNNQLVNDLIIYDKKNTGNRDFFKLIQTLRRNKYDLIISPHRSSRSALISKLSKAKKTITFDNSSLSFLYDEKVNYNNDIHEIQRNLKLLEPLDIYENKIIKPELFIGKEENEKISNYLSVNDIASNDVLFCIAPGSVWFTKRFPKEKFIRLCDLLANTEYKIILVGGERDKNISEEILNNTINKNVIDSTGKFSILESAELIKRAAILITNDSAPLHIANSVGTDVIAIFGATVPSFGFYPYGKNDIIIETSGLKCRPCSIHGGKKCPIGTFVCMMDIKEERIYDSVITILKRK